VVSDPSVQAKKMLGLEHWGQILGTGRGSLKNWSYVTEATKKAICWPFVKPSDGLEPSTPSLPWRLKARQRVGRFALPALFFLGLRGFVVPLDVFLDPPRVTLRSPVPVPKTCPQDTGCLGADERASRQMTRLGRHSFHRSAPNG
jgi:hypothetical protein